ncbi:hypothetical protein JCM13664_21640 [Methylothermus subterraneus]
MIAVQPDPAEEAMLQSIICDLLADAERQGQAGCRFRRFRIHVRNLSRSRRRVTVVAGNEPVIDGDVET